MWRLGRALGQGIAAVAGWRMFKPAVFVACLVPLLDLAWAFYRAFTGRVPTALGTDPTKTLLHETGETALTILLITLCVTPIRRLFGVNRVQNVRRMLGLWAFTYAAIHLSIYLVFDQLCYSMATCEGQAIWQDILKRRFIFVGQFGFLLLAVLALTSTTGWMRRLKKNWVRLHRLVYVAAAAGVVHFVWIQKADISDPLKYAAWLAVLLAIRAYFAFERRAARSGVNP